MTDAKKTVTGADLAPGITIKHPGHNRIYLINDIEEPDDIGARLTECKTTSGEYVTFNVFTDSLYELRSAAPRPRTVMLSLPRDLADQLDRARLGSDETTAQAIVRLVRQAMDDWGG